MPELTVTSGDNNLSTCYQYAVTDATGCKFLGIKFYDKMIDLIGREATHLVGSRVSTIVGSCRSKDAFSQRLCQAQLTGLTRLEVSIYPDTEGRYNPMLPSVKTLWHLKIQRALDELVAGVLNNTKVLCKTYRRLNVPLLLASLVRSDINVLAIGRRASWIVNARTPDRRRFTGTKINYGYDPTLC